MRLRKISSNTPQMREVNQGRLRDGGYMGGRPPQFIRQMTDTSTTTIRISNNEIVVRREGATPLRFCWSDEMQTWAPCILPEQAMPSSIK